MKNYRYNFKNWFDTDLEWKQTFQIKDFFPNDSLWKFSDFLPHVTFFSVFGDKNAIKKSRAKTKIFFTGEDTSQNFTDFNDHCVGDADLSIGFASEESVNAPNYIRYPLWLLYYFGEYKTLPQIQTAIDESLAFLAEKQTEIRRNSSRCRAFRDKGPCPENSAV